MICRQLSILVFFLLLLSNQMMAQLILPDDVSKEDKRILQQFNCVAQQYEVIYDKPAVADRFHEFFFADDGIYQNDPEDWSVILVAMAENLRLIENYLIESENKEIPAELSALKPCFCDDRERLRQLVLYPNPSHSDATITGNFNEGDHLSIMDLESGNDLVKKKIVNSSNSELITLDRFPDGLYLVSVQSGSESKQFIVIKN